jgi:hypothetical protein
MGQRHDEAQRKIRDRAVAIYQWAFDNQSLECFKAQMVEGYCKGKTEQMAFEMLTIRGLLRRTKAGASVPWWTLNRVCDPSQCLAIATESPAPFRGVTAYRVPPSVAESMGASPDLQQYAIGGVRKW